MLTGSSEGPKISSNSYTFAPFTNWNLLAFTQCKVSSPASSKAYLTPRIRIDRESGWLPPLGPRPTSACPIACAILPSAHR